MSHTTPLTHTLPPVAILGAGAVTHLGRGLDDIAAQLSHENSLTTTQPAVGPGVTQKAVDDALLFDPKLDRKLRRADRFVRMSCIAALDAWEQAQPIIEATSNASASSAGVPAPNKVGMIIASGFGPHQRGFRFLDGLLDHGDKAASPTDFSHSVHGSASAYISGLLELRGPTFSITDFQAGFAQAVQLAQCWIHQNLCDHVLVGATEELGAVLLSVAQQCLPPGAHYNAGEGSMFLVLGKSENQTQPCLQIHATTQAITTPQNVDLYIAPHNVYRPLVPPLPAQLTFKARTSFLNSLGHNASDLAFETLGGMLAMRDPKLPLCRTQSSPASRQPSPTAAGVVNTALALVSCSDTQSASLLLSRRGSFAPRR